MNISDEELTHLETLARIEVVGDDREELRNDLSAVLDYFGSIEQLDTDGVEELVRPVAMQNVLRADEIRPSLDRDRTMELAVESEEGYFKVPRMLDGSG